MTQLVTNEQPVAIAPSVTKVIELPSQYTSQPCLNQVPVYSNILAHMQIPLSKSQSFSNNLDAAPPDKVEEKVDDLHLDAVVIRENHIMNNITEKRNVMERLDNDLTLQDKENILLSASRLRLLQDTTMIESALDLDSLDDLSIGNNSQAGLMKL